MMPKGGFSMRSTSVEKPSGSRASTNQSTPEKAKNDEVQLASEIQKNLLQRSEIPQVSPLAAHEVSWDYRTKMVDWMVEVCHSFKTSERSYFLSVALFDQALRKYSQKLQNPDVHLIGVTCMYLASKYEDVYPLHSKTIADKISHKAFQQKQITHKEEELLRLFEFKIDFVTPLDLHQLFVKLIASRVPASGLE